MVKKIFVLGLMLLFLISPAFAVTVDTKISGNVVSFSSIGFSTNSVTTPNIVTFNTFTRHIRITNLSSTYDCWVDLLCKDSTGKTGYMTSNSSTVFVAANGGNGNASPSVVEFDFATKNLGFTTKPRTGLNYVNMGSKPYERDVMGSDRKIHYTVTTDVGDF